MFPATIINYIIDNLTAKLGPIKTFVDIVQVLKRMKSAQTFHQSKVTKKSGNTAFSFDSY